MENTPKETLAHFLENRNFTMSKKCQKKRKQVSKEEHPKESLIIVDGQVVMSKESAKSQIIEDRITSFSYRKNTNGRGKWSKEETILFYQGLSLCGTDFTLLEKIFTDKTRRQIKNKFTNEEKNQPEKVTQILTSPKKFKREELEALKKEYTEIRRS